jgi:hypothetical protein
MLSAAARCCLFQAEGKSRMKKSLLALGLTVLTGCAIEHVSPEDPKSFIPDRSAVIAVGRMDRAAVRGILGTTRLSSAYWGFDLFRTDTEQSEVVYAVQLQRFTLVAYDADGRASAVASGLFRRPAKWRNTSPITFDHPSLHLRAGELMFFADPEGARDVNLLVSPLRRDAFLEGARSAKGCTAVLGCGDRGCGDRLTVDASPPRRLPVRTAHAYWFGKGEPDSWLRGAEPHGSDARMPWLEALVALKLAAGEHALEFSAAHLDGRMSLHFKCRPGEIIYLTIHASSNESFWRPALVDWRIDQDATMPERFARRPMVIMDDGKWVIDAEPVG